MAKQTDLPIYADERRSALQSRLNRIDGQVRGVSKMLDDQRPCVEVLHQLASIQAAIRGVTKEVLRNYLEGERLTQIPAKHSKRMIILAWLADKFDTGMKYPEKTVNEMLKRYHLDCASLRRALVDHGFMQREGGIYWRIRT